MKKLDVTPLSDRLIIKPFAAKNKTEGGIIIPDTAKEIPSKGTVVAVGGKSKYKMVDRLCQEGKSLIKDADPLVSVRMNEILDELRNSISCLVVKEGDTVLYNRYSGSEISIQEEELLTMRESEILAIV